MLLRGLLLLLQDVDWEFEEGAADDDVAMGGSDEEGMDDDPGYRKQLGEQGSREERERGREMTLAAHKTACKLCRAVCCWLVCVCCCVRPVPAHTRSACCCTHRWTACPANTGLEGDEEEEEEEAKRAAKEDEAAAPAAPDGAPDGAAAAAAGADAAGAAADGAGAPDGGAGDGEDGMEEDEEFDADEDDDLLLEGDEDDFDADDLDRLAAETEVREWRWGRRRPRIDGHARCGRLEHCASLHRHAMTSSSC